MLLFEIIFWLYFGIAVFEHIEKTGNDLLYFVLGELGANPDDEAGYSRHWACLRQDAWSSTTFNPTSVGRGKPILNKTLRERLCGNDGLVGSVEKSPVTSRRERFRRLSHTSHKALEKPTAEKSLRLSHIPTKAAVTF